MNDAGDINHWSTREEGQFFERKSAYDRSGGKVPKKRKATLIAWDIAETMCAMANADGGELVVGMEDDGDITGIPHPDDKLRMFRETPGSDNYVQPSPRFQVQGVRAPGDQLLLHFTVDSSPEVHHLANGKYLMRIADRNMPFPAEQIAALKNTKGQGLIERSFPVGASLDDIDLELVAALQPKMGFDGSAEDVLRRLRLVEGRNGRSIPNLAGLLLFGNDPSQWHPSCDIDFVRWEGTERRTGADLNIEKRIRVEAPLAVLIQQAYDVIRPYIRERQRLHDLFFTEKLEYPSYVWQEAIINAVGHRDYSIRGASIQVWMLDDRIEVRSPGLPPPPATINALNRGESLHVSRNPLIVRTLAMLGYMRELGEGIPRMFSVMESEGFYPPRFDDIGSAYFQVTLLNEPVYDRETLEWLRQFDGIDLSGDQKRLLAYARAHDFRFTNRDFQKLAGLDLYSASNSIKALIRKGVVCSTGKGSRIYEVVKPVSTLTELPRGVVQLLPLLLKKGAISNEDIRAVRDVSRSIATRLATDLWQGGWLERSGEGRWTRYRLSETSLQILNSRDRREQNPRIQGCP